MNKRIVICADGTWNRPEQDPKQDVPTNVLRLARAIKPSANDGTPQQVFYDWGVGSYHDRVVGGATGRGLHKNIMDDYRYIVQNYSPGDQLFLFGFSRGAYTVRCLCGLINNCGIVTRPEAALIQAAFNHYKRSSKAYSPSGAKSVEFRNKYSHPSRKVEFVGVWDTVGAMGIPLRFLGFLDGKDEFYDKEIGGNVAIARHAMAIDELRVDFEPTVWERKQGLDLKQVWFCGAHTDIGGGYKPDRDGSLLSDIPLSWMIRQAKGAGLSIEPHLSGRLRPNARAKLHQSRRSFYKLKPAHHRSIQHAAERRGAVPDVVRIHASVKERWESDSGYRPKNLRTYIAANGWPNQLEK
jgi:uncharacterized protein (DUF2235 family)